MVGINKVILIGHVGKDPDVWYLENGRARATFTLATQEVYTNQAGGKVTHTEWHQVVLWTPLAEVAEAYLHKGRRVYIEGKLATRSCVGQDQRPYTVTEVVGKQLVLLDKGTESSCR